MPTACFLLAQVLNSLFLFFPFSFFVCFRSIRQHAPRDGPPETTSIFAMSTGSIGSSTTMLRVECRAKKLLHKNSAPFTIVARVNKVANAGDRGFGKKYACSRAHCLQECINFAEMRAVAKLDASHVRHLQYRFRRERKKEEEKKSKFTHMHNTHIHTRTRCTHMHESGTKKFYARDLALTRERGRPLLHCRSNRGPRVEDSKSSQA